MGSQATGYTAGPKRISVRGLLFDMDGTIVDSTAAVVKHWRLIGQEIGVDGDVILETSHGRRSIDVLKIVHPEKANWDYIKNMEGQLPILYGSDAVEIPGARSLLDAVQKAHIPWAIVTSGTTPLVTGWLKVLDLPTPRHLVVAEDVENGKPDPTCYLMGREKLGLVGGGMEEVLVLEDSPAGIRAGKESGCKVLAVVTSHSVEQVLAAEPDYVVKDLRSVRVVGGGDGGWEVEILDAYVGK